MSRNVNASQQNISKLGDTTIVSWAQELYAIITVEYVHPSLFDCLQQMHNALKPTSYYTALPYH